MRMSAKSILIAANLDDNHKAKENEHMVPFLDPDYCLGSADVLRMRCLHGVLPAHAAAGCIEKGENAAHAAAC